MEGYTMNHIHALKSFDLLGFISSTTWIHPIHFHLFTHHQSLISFNVDNSSILIHFLSSAFMDHEITFIQSNDFSSFNVLIILTTFIHQRLVHQFTFMYIKHRIHKISCVPLAKLMHHLVLSRFC
jgi:hypothetical protein